ncbi:MAG: LPD5 domain-containing protein [Candidatus Margulisiibacteriota bacterium]
MKGITLKENHYSIYRGEKDVTKWQIEQSRKATALSNMPRELGVGNTKDEAITSFKEKYDSLGEKIEPTRLVKFDIYSKREEAGVWIGKKIGRNYVDLKKFDNAKDAMEYRKENRDDLVKALEQYKTIPFERREVNRERIGKDHRNGKDVTPEMFTEFFGFRGVEFGNWVNSQERQDNLNRAFDALMDMSIILDIPTKAISLNGELGLGFGSRGIGGKRAPAAHYEPSKVVINLTRKSGPGSLAHEWWHALDNYFSRGRGKKLEYISDRATKFQDDPTRIEILDAFKNVVATIDNTGMKKRAAELDRRRTKPYWTKGIELSARAFENYMVERLSQRGDVNDYLVNIESAESYGADMMEGLLSGDLTAMDMYPYLIESEIENVSNAFNHLFNTMESKETDKGVELYSTQVSDIPGLTLDDVQKMFKGQTVGLSPDGAIWVRTTGGNGLRIEMVSRIDADNAAFEFGYGRMGKDETLSGKYHKGTIFLQRDIADRWTLAHESMHWMEDAGIVNAKESEVLKAYIRGMVKKGTFLTLNEKDIGGREDRAQFISDSLRERGGLSNPIQRVIQKIQDFIDGLVNLFHRTAMGITRDIETGKIYDRGMRRAGIPTEAIAYQKTADRWYSQMEREISSPKFPNRGTPQSMANIINSWAKKGMIKDEELQWSGLLDWLKDQEGKVSKQDVLDYLSANNLRLEEVVKGGPKLTKEQSDRLEELSEWDEAGNLSEAEAQEYEQLSSLVRQYKQEGGYGTKFSKYQMPGGENYREMLITMPAKKRPDTFDEWVKLESKGDLPTSTPFNDLPEHMKTILVNRFDKYFPAEKGYVGTHWEEPNVLAHVRMNDRTGPKGEKVLFIEELQSDFGQAYRKQLKNIENAVDNNLKDIVRSMEKSGVLKEIC